MDGEQTLRGPQAHVDIRIGEPFANMCPIRFGSGEGDGQGRGGAALASFAGLSATRWQQLTDTNVAVNP